MKVKTKELTGYHHIFHHVAGGCGVGSCAKENNGHCCDDVYKCLVCGMEIKLLSKPEGHFEMPTIFYGRNCCDKELEQDEHRKTVLRVIGEDESNPIEPPTIQVDVRNQLRQVQRDRAEKLTGKLDAEAK